MASSMLYIFLMETGNLKLLKHELTKSSNLSVELASFASLKALIHEKFYIPASDQVLLISGGIDIEENSDCWTSAGKDETNPLFVYRKNPVDYQIANQFIQTNKEDLEAEIDKQLADLDKVMWPDQQLAHPHLFTHTHAHNSPVGGGGPALNVAHDLLGARMNRVCDASRVAERVIKAFNKLLDEARLLMQGFFTALANQLEVCASFSRTLDAAHANLCRFEREDLDVLAELERFESVCARLRRFRVGLEPALRHADGSVRATRRHRCLSFPAASRDAHYLSLLSPPRHSYDSFNNSSSTSSPSLSSPSSSSSSSLLSNQPPVCCLYDLICKNETDARLLNSMISRAKSAVSQLHITEEERNSQQKQKQQQEGETDNVKEEERRTNQPHTSCRQPRQLTELRKIIEEGRKCAGEFEATLTDNSISPENGAAHPSIAAAAEMYSSLSLSFTANAGVAGSIASLGPIEGQNGFPEMMEFQQQLGQMEAEQAEIVQLSKFMTVFKQTVEKDKIRLNNQQHDSQIVHEVLANQANSYAAHLRAPMTQIRGKLHAISQIKRRLLELLHARQLWLAKFQRRLAHTLGQLDRRTALMRHVRVGRALIGQLDAAPRLFSLATREMARRVSVSRVWLRFAANVAAASQSVCEWDARCRRRIHRALANHFLSGVAEHKGGGQDDSRKSSANHRTGGLFAPLLIRSKADRQLARLFTHAQQSKVTRRVFDAQASMMTSFGVHFDLDRVQRALRTNQREETEVQHEMEDEEEEEALLRRFPANFFFSSSRISEKKIGPDAFDPNLIEEIESPTASLLFQLNKYEVKEEENTKKENEEGASGDGDLRDLLHEKLCNLEHVERLGGVSKETKEEEEKEGEKDEEQQRDESEEKEEEERERAELTESFRRLRSPTLSDEDGEDEKEEEEERERTPRRNQSVEKTSSSDREVDENHDDKTTLSNQHCQTDAQLGGGGGVADDAIFAENIIDAEQQRKAEDSKSVGEREIARREIEELRNKLTRKQREMEEMARRNLEMKTVIAAMNLNVASHTNTHINTHTGSASSSAEESGVTEVSRMLTRSAIIAQSDSANPVPIAPNSSTSSCTSPSPLPHLNTCVITLTNFRAEDPVMFVFQMDNRQWRMVSGDNRVYFLHEDDWSALQLHALLIGGAAPPGSTNQSRHSNSHLSWIVAIFERKEKCIAKKAGNRFNLPLHFEFFRVRARPLPEPPAVKIVAASTAMQTSSASSVIVGEEDSTTNQNA